MAVNAANVHKIFTEQLHSKYIATFRTTSGKLDLCPWRGPFHNVKQPIKTQKMSYLIDMNKPHSIFSPTEMFKAVASQQKEKKKKKGQTQMDGLKPKV